MNKSLEEKFEELEGLLEELEKSDTNLDESIEIYQRAKALYKEVNDKLEDYRAKIEIISKDE